MSSEMHQQDIAGAGAVAQHDGADLDIEKVATREDLPQLQQVRSHASHHDLHATISTHTEANAAQYERFSPHRKIIITTILSLSGLLAPISSTAILSAIPEVAATYNSTGSIINLSNAMYMLFMGFSPCFWGPLSQVYGRRWICIVAGTLFFAFSVGTALAPNLSSYFIFRILTAFQGTAFLIVGTACLGDIYTPTERGTALGWFFSGTLVGPAFGPFIGGIIVTFRSWRDIFWLQSALGGLATVLVVFLLPETIPSKKLDDLHGLSRARKVRLMAAWINPMRVIMLLYDYPNLMALAAASSSLVWNMYSLLTPIRYVLNPRFHLTSPIQSGLFYIAPGIGYLLGTFVGGRWADRTVKVWIKKRGGKRLPEDRLRSCVPFIGIVTPACMLIYGWSVDKAVGGIPLPVLAMFFQGVSQLFCFPSLNTYCVDVMQAKGRSAEVIAGNYMMRYFFACLGTAVVLPAVEKIGVGWFSTISTVFLVASAGAVVATIRWGQTWRQRVDERKKQKKIARAEKAQAADGEELARGVKESSKV